MGGRWSQEITQFLRGLVLFKSAGTPGPLRERGSTQSCAKAIDAGLWSLASKKAVRPFRSSSNWQLHVHVKPIVHCGSPRFLFGGKGSVGCLLCRAAPLSDGSVVFLADDQVEGTDGSVPE